MALRQPVCSDQEYGFQVNGSVVATTDVCNVVSRNSVAFDRQQLSVTRGGAASERVPPSGGIVAGWRSTPVSLPLYPAPDWGPSLGPTPAVLQEPDQTFSS